MFYLWEELSVFFTSLLGQKRLILFLSWKIQVFKVTDGPTIVNCQRLLISSEAEKMYNGFYQVCSKKPQQSKTFWSKAQSKISLFFGLHVWLFTDMRNVGCSAKWTSSFQEGHRFAGLCFLLKIIKCQSKKKKKSLEKCLLDREKHLRHSFLQISIETWNGLDWKGP